MRILLIEDDALLGNGIQMGLTQSNHALDWVQTAKEGELALLNENYACLILDLSLPDKDGLCVLKDLRKNNNPLPVLILTARDRIEDKIKGLDTGADDYLVKPFDLDELHARLRALQRRRNGQTSPVIEFAGLCLNPATHNVSINGQTIDLSNKEFKLLQQLLENKGQVISRIRLEENLYGWNEMVESNAVEVHIHHLRKKLGKTFIQTVRGVGYVIR